jgi:hypothetical protein
VSNNQGSPTPDDVPAGQPENIEQPSVTFGDMSPQWCYIWPDGVEENFFKSRWYFLHLADGTERVRVGWTRRAAWGRKDRMRVVVFHQLGGKDSTTYYPWTEFVETNDGRYAAPIPDPLRPRAIPSDASRLPRRFNNSVVERSDAIFTSIAKGPSLRLVVGDHEELAMVQHGHWVAVLRHRI